MRSFTGLLTLFAVVLMLGCGGPTSPSPAFTITPVVAHMQVGQTQVFTIEGSDYSDFNFTPNPASSNVKVTRDATTISVTYLKKSTMTMSTMRVFHRSGQENDRFIDVTIYFD